MKPGPKPGSFGRSKAEIAAVAIAAIERGDPMIPAVAAHFGCSNGAARAAIRQARQAGQPIPLRSAGRPPSDAQKARTATAARNAVLRASGEYGSLGPRSTPGPVRCSCGQVCKSRTALGAHCWALHDRWPSDAERVILVEQAVA